MIFDEADRMLDLGFEREMNQCLQLIKKKCDGKFLSGSEKFDESFYSEQIKINFISATMSQNVE